ncbi:histidinol-phosphatase HisJ [Fictibacillus iocasae]|uniref:Histidinol-phosphatase n=1 Tax=Fictibacillus iocasae TaxID=2715437 RepID=A0ABW2NUX2_9BACL
MRFDGHVHTPFCPHGSSDTLNEYAERALSLGYSGITFTEHAPLPYGFTDPVPESDSAMKREDLPRYFQALKEIKQEFKGRLQIFTGLEVDFIEGFEKETDAFLTDVQDYLDDAILSVHFLQHKGKYWCMDYSEDLFGEMASVFGSVDDIYAAYYKTVKDSVQFRFSSFQPRRIGHITLARKFHKRYPAQRTFAEDILFILEEIKARDYQLDYNGAGTVKPNCQEPYPSDWVVQEAAKRKIPLVYGSDAHTAAGLHQGFSELLYRDKLASPFFLDGAE